MTARKPRIAWVKARLAMKCTPPSSDVASGTTPLRPLGAADARNDPSTDLSYSCQAQTDDRNKQYSIGAARANNGRLDAVQYLRKPIFLDEH